MSRVLNLMAATAALSAASMALAQPIPKLFETWMGFDTGVYPEFFAPNSLAVADLDGDGDTDALVGHEFWWMPGISVLLNLGDGTYGPPAHYALPQGKSVGRVALADVDGDGDPDSIATIPDQYGLSNTVAVWKNAGNGSLAPRTEFAAGAGPIGLALADFNGDGRPDIATANYGYIGQGTTISVLMNNGSGGYLAPASYTVGEAVFALAAGDVTGDGLADLAYARANGTIGLLHNTGAGVLTLSTVFTPNLWDGPTVALKDLDNDGDLDLITTAMEEQGSINIGQVVVRRNRGDGAFDPRVSHALDNFSMPPPDCAFADLNHDGWPDIAGCDSSARTTDGVRVLMSDGSGGYQNVAVYPAAQATVQVAAADADLDGHADIVTLARYSSELTVHHNRGDGVLVRAPLYPIGAIFGNQMSAADIDGDADLDVAVSFGGLGASGGVSVLRNAGDGAFGAAEVYPSPQQAMSVRLHDLNGDARPDLIWADDYPPYNFKTRLNLGGGQYGAIQNWSANTCGNGGVDAMDLDNDGDRDAVLVESLGCPSVPFAGRRLFLYRNDGTGIFTFVDVVIASSGVSGVGSADFNHDGKLDLVARTTGIEVFFGNGNMTFAAPITSPGDYSSFDLGDYNQDGELDAAVAIPCGSFGTDRVGVALGNGDGTFQSAVVQTGSSVLETLGITAGVVAGDADHDGLLDIITVNYASNDHSVFLGNGDGTVRPQVRYGSAHNPSSMALADFTGDAMNDIVSVVGMPPSGFQSALAVVRGVPSGCYPDCNTDGALTVSDFGCFQTQFVAGDPYADCTADGQLTVADFGCFQTQFVAGCP